MYRVKVITPDEARTKNENYFSLEEQINHAIKRINRSLINYFHLMEFRDNKCVNSLKLCTVDICHGVSNRKIREEGKGPKAEKSHKDFINFLVRYVFPVFRDAGWGMELMPCECCYRGEFLKRESCMNVVVYPTEEMQPVGKTNRYEIMDI